MQVPVNLEPCSRGKDRRFRQLTLMRKESEMAKKALIVGINDYAPVGAGGPDLRGCVADARDMANTLHVLGIVPAVPASMRILTNANATRANIVSGLKWLIPGAKANDVLAGEGVSAITTSATSATFRPSTSSVGVEGDILGCIVDPVLYPSIVVAGAGTAAAIGTYTQRGTSDSKPFYNLVGEVDAISTSPITWETADTRWVIYDSLGDISYLSLDEVAKPDLVTPGVNTAPAQGTLPVPTVTAGANPTFDVDVIYYDAAL